MERNESVFDKLKQLSISTKMKDTKEFFKLADIEIAKINNLIIKEGE